jgi:hypothetical protein
MKKLKRYTMFKNSWFLFFAISHTLGWLLANLQTVWIIYDQRKGHKEILKAIKKDRE